MRSCKILAAIMAPVELDDNPSNLRPIVWYGTLLSTNVFLLALVGSSLYKAYRRQPVSQRTRAAGASHTGSVILFLVLAAVSWLVNALNVTDSLYTSYSTWKLDQTHAAAPNIWTSPAWYPHDPGRLDGLQLGRWARDSRFVDVIQLAQPIGYWWFQQLGTASAIWAVVLAIECMIVSVGQSNI